MGIFRLKRKTFGLIPGLGNLSNAFRAGSAAMTAKAGSNVAKGMGSIAKKQAALGAAKLGGTALVVGGTVSAAKKLTGETD